MNSTTVMELTRIGMRYLGMFLVTRGAMNADTSTAIFADPAMIEMIAGLASAALAEIGYAIAKIRAAK